MIAIIYNHDMFDDPYNQTAIEKGVKNLEKLLSTYGKYYITLGERRNMPLVTPDLSDEYVLVQHTIDLSQEQKEQLATLIKATLTLKKTVYRDELPQGCIIFEKIEEQNVFTF